MNTSGLRPLDLRVVVRPDTAEEKTAGGIILTGSEVEKNKYAMCKGTLIAVGENAWEEASARSAAFVKPIPGDRVMIAKYGGVMFKGPDGVDYRIMNDDDIVGKLED